MNSVKEQVRNATKREVWYQIVVSIDRQVENKVWHLVTDQVRKQVKIRGWKVHNNHNE